MKTKKDLEKKADNISPEIKPAIPPNIARSQKVFSTLSEQEAHILDSSFDKKS